MDQQFAFGILGVIWFASSLIAYQSLYRGVLLAVAALPWTGLGVDVGLSVSFYQMVAVALVPATVAQLFSTRSSEGSAVAHNPALVAFVVYSVAWSVIQIPGLPSADVSGGSFRSPTNRALAQLFQFGVLLIPILVLPRAVHGLSQVAAIGRTFIISLTMLALLGWIQLGVWGATGVDPLPIGIVPVLLGGDPEDTRSASFVVEQTEVYRMSSLGGEPKHLGSMLVAGLLLLQLFWMVTPSSVSRKQLGLFGFLAASAAATVSTTGLYLWIIGTVVLAVVVTTYLSSVYSNRIFAMFTLSLSMILGVTAVITVILSKDIESSFLASVVRLITVEREFGVIEDFDEGIIQYLLENPERALLGSGLGNIHLFADEYLAPVVSIFAGGTVFVAKAGYLRILSELGIVGLVLLTATVFYEIGKCRAYVRKLSVRGERLSAALLATVGGGLLLIYISFLAVGTLVFALYVMLGLIMASRMAAGRLLSAPRGPIGHSRILANLV